jgi:hypothetical protein
MERTVLLPYTQQPASGLHPEPSQFIHTPTLYFILRIPKSRYYNEIAEETKQKGQIEWEKCDKATITKQYFSKVQDRLNMKLNITTNLAAILTGHGKTRTYLHRFKLLDHVTCVCKKGYQTIDYLRYQCTLL